MKFVKAFSVMLGTALLAWGTSFAYALVGIQCTEVSMLTARDPMGPIALYRQLVSLCGIGGIVVIVIGLVLIFGLWYFAYLKKLTKKNKEN